MVQETSQQPETVQGNLKLLAVNGSVISADLRLGQAILDATADFHLEDEKKIREQYAGKNLSDDCVMDVSYLRTRSRWSPELEARLVESHLAGKVVMICDWPDHEDKNYNPFTGEPL